MEAEIKHNFGSKHGANEDCFATFVKNIDIKIEAVKLIIFFNSTMKPIGTIQIQSTCWVCILYNSTELIIGLCISSRRFHFEFPCGCNHYFSFYLPSFLLFFVPYPHSPTWRIGDGKRTCCVGGQTGQVGSVGQDFFFFFLIIILSGVQNYP